MKDNFFLKKFAGNFYILQTTGLFILITGLFANISYGRTSIYWPGESKNIPAGTGFTCQIDSDNTNSYKRNLWTDCGSIWLIGRDVNAGSIASQTQIDSQHWLLDVPYQIDLKSGTHFYAFIQTKPLRFGGTYKVGVIDVNNPASHTELTLNVVADYLHEFTWDTNKWLWLSDCNFYDFDADCCVSGPIYQLQTRSSSLWQIFYHWLVFYDGALCGTPHDNPHDLNNDNTVNLKDFAILCNIYEKEANKQ